MKALCCGRDLYRIFMMRFLEIQHGIFTLKIVSLTLKIKIMETYGYNNPPEGPSNNPNYQSEKKLVAGILAILLGALGIHKFYMGYNKEGIILLLSTLIILPLLTVITCGVGSFLYPVVVVIPLIEGIIYLTMPDEQFDNTYIRNQKPWF